MQVSVAVSRDEVIALYPPDTETKRDRMIVLTIPLAIMVAKRVCPARRLEDDYVSEGMLALTRAVAGMAIGECDNPSPLDYIFGSVYHACLRLRKKNRWRSIDPNGVKSVISRDPATVDMDDLIKKVCRTPQEAEVIRLRLANFSFQEIGTKCGVTGSRIGQIKNDIASRLRPYLINR